MYKRVVEYTDLNGVTKKEAFYFNYNESEILEMELKETGGLEAKLKKIIACKDVPKLTELFKDLIINAYGEKSEDGSFFYKSDELKKKFECHVAYPIIYMSIIKDHNLASEFINGVIPQEVADSIKNMDLSEAANNIEL